MLAGCITAGDVQNYHLAYSFSQILYWGLKQPPVSGLKTIPFTVLAGLRLAL